MRTNRKPLSRFRFSIALLLFVALCAAGILSGYRTGFEQGYAGGAKIRESEQPYPMVHSVGEVLRYAADPEDTADTSGRLNFDPLIEVIQTAIFPAKWDVLGGPSGCNEASRNRTQSTLTSMYWPIASAAKLK